MGRLSAKEIGAKLNILPHAVYRAIKPLEELGIVLKLATYPTIFEAQSIQDSADLLSLEVKENFQEIFSGKNQGFSSPQLLKLSFIKNRSDLLEKTSKDIQNAKESIDFIVSGLEIPAESVLSFKQAFENGVAIRAVIQDCSEATEGLLRTWDKLGVMVRYYPNMEARIFIIDNEIVYFTSYNPEEKVSGIGVRFHYAPYAKLMNELFEQRWKLSSPILF
jgi:sugar-specific transcriptional regulator TrmB